MKKVLLIGLICVIGCIFSGSVFAAGCSSQGCTAPVDIIYPSASDGGRVFVKLKGIDMSSANCTLAENTYYTLYADHLMYDENLKSIQMAAAMGKEIYLRIVEGSNVCEISYTRAYF